MGSLVKGSAIILSCDLYPNISGLVVTQQTVDFLLTALAKCWVKLSINNRLEDNINNMAILLTHQEPIMYRGILFGFVVLYELWYKCL